MAVVAMNILALLVLSFQVQQAVSQDQSEGISMIQKSAAIKRGKAQKGAAARMETPATATLESSVPMQVLTEGVCSAEGPGTCSSKSSTKRKGTVKKATVKRAGGRKPIMPEPEADGADIFSDGIAAAVQFSQKSATVHRAKPAFTPPESSLDTSALGYERVSADVLAILNAESGMLEEGISMVQKSASVHRVGVDADGHMPKLSDPAKQPQQPLAWEPVDPDLDIMSLIEEEEGISM